MPDLLNQPVTDPATNRSIRAVQLTPEWVTSKNMLVTVVADGFVTYDFLCDGDQAACAAAGITPKR